MKKIYRFFTAAIAISLCAAACQQENLEPSVSEEVTGETESAGVVFTVNASMSEQTRATLNDGETIKWTVGDDVAAWSEDKDGNVGHAAAGLLETSSVSSVDETSTSASFSFSTLPQGGRSWIAVGSNTGYDALSAKMVEFGFPASLTQEKAGAVNSSMIKLVSDAISVPTLADDETSVTLSAEMKIVGTLMRFLVYSATGLRAEENVQSIQLVSADNIIAGNGSAAMAFNLAEGGYRQNNETVPTSGAECVLYWDATSKSITTNLAAPLSLEGLKEATEGTGIYMSVPPVKISGYKYIVTTDVARYTFDASTSAMVFGENTLKNVLLNLEHENVDRIELDSIKGDLQYEGDLNAASQVISYEGVTDKDGGYWYARVKDTGATGWVTREGTENVQYYTGVQFSCIDNATGEPADWVTVSYRTDGNTHWWISVDPQAEGAAERSATVTATFSDVDGYLITEACKTKVVTITQQAYSTIKTLGFYGGIGDQTISGAEVIGQSLGYCVITVNGVLAERWSTDENNEQELYGEVVIECRDGAANGPIVDWLTVEYGKDDDDRFNSTHLLATAKANDTGAERKALVCCTYHAPEGYEFEGGATQFFRQFFVTQPADTGVRTISFDGGLGAENSHDHTAQTAWGLSWWVVKVDGANATDWDSDSHNEQAIYGGAEFKCYDYTNGVRGAEVDWVTVDYKTENGKVIDTWWLADIQENTTGAVRKAEIVCTFPELEGYAYKDGQNVRTTIITQSPAETAEGGEDDVVVEGYTYDIVKNNGNASGAAWGMPVGGKNGADFRIENIKLNGTAVTLTEDMAKEVLALAIKNVDERPAAGYDDYAFASTQIYMNLISYNGSTLEAGVATTADSQGYITRLTWYGADGTEGGHWFVFVP